MPYNNYYPATYSPMQPQFNYGQQYNQQGMYTPPVQSYTGPSPTQIVWVQGESAAKAYPVSPGSNNILMDSEGEYFYIKSVDASGMPQPLRTFTYQEVTNTQPATPGNSNSFDPNSYVSRSEYDELKRQLDELRAQTSSMQSSFQNAYNTPMTTPNHQQNSYDNNQNGRRNNGGNRNGQ